MQPQGRIGNILARLVLRDWEIPYLGRSAVDEEHRIPVTNLAVSVVGQRIVLTSKRSGREPGRRPRRRRKSRRVEI